MFDFILHPCTFKFSFSYCWVLVYCVLSRIFDTDATVGGFYPCFCILVLPFLSLSVSCSSVLYFSVRMHQFIHLSAYFLCFCLNKFARSFFFTLYGMYYEVLCVYRLSDENEFSPFWNKAVTWRNVKPAMWTLSWWLYMTPREGYSISSFKYILYWDIQFTSRLEKCQKIL